MRSLHGKPSTAESETTRGPRHSAQVAMIGAGQLARMTFQAATDLDIDLKVLAAHSGQPAARAGAPWVEGEASDVAATLQLAAAADVVTFDHELVPSETVKALLASGATVRPGPAALRMACDKLHARRELTALGFPVPKFAEVNSVADAARFAESVGWPIVLKATSGGYDGRGVSVAHSSAEVERVITDPGPWLAEEFVQIAMELSVLVARTPSGHCSAYPVVETRQADGICRELVMPADIPADLADQVTRLAVSLVNGIDACGITAVELLITSDLEPLICEIAARPHNSGHATIEACATSQFENHLRGVLDWPLGSTQMRAPAAAMVNVLGAVDGLTPTRLPAALAVEGASVHLYGKTELPGRKIGHVAATGSNPTEALERARAAAAALSGQ